MEETPLKRSCVLSAGACFWDLNSNSEVGLKIKFVKNYSFSKTTLLKREPFLTMCHIMLLSTAVLL